MLTTGKHHYNKVYITTFYKDGVLSDLNSWVVLEHALSACFAHKILHPEDTIKMRGYKHNDNSCYYDINDACAGCGNC
jgi:hypothetical protein